MRISVFFTVLLFALIASAQEPGPMPPPMRTAPPPNSTHPKSTSTPPRSDDQPESSSKDTKVDLSPPKGDSMAHPNSGSVTDDVMELHPYNPMRAMKDVEVGDFHYRRKNYKAAVSRYREALEYKPHDAVATFALAQALEKSGDHNGALESYEDYLKTLPNGPQASECRKAIERLSKSAKQNGNK
jgi:tetratricopeptide (TPR) repeat protein